ERGAPHVVDPSKLIASASRLYVGQMERLWGEILPVPEKNLIVVSGGERIVAENSHLVAFCPWASRFPYEVWIVPRQGESDFAAVTAAEAGQAAAMTRDLIGRIERTLGNVGYNYLLHTQPFDSSRYDYYHWHIELFPRITKVAGFEWSTGVFINTVAPETAAAELRDAAVPAGKNLAAVPTGKTS
ncbi:MAG: DUF4921 family protein, partial [Pirellulaceae bacterium]